VPKPDDRSLHDPAKPTEVAIPGSGCSSS